jgi:hypothetical protein
LLAKQLCPERRIEATTEGFEDDESHVRIDPPAGMGEEEIADIEGKLADRCVDIATDKRLKNLLTATQEELKLQADISPEAVMDLSIVRDAQRDLGFGKAP